MLSRFLCKAKVGKPLDKKAIETLKEDFKGENSDARDEDLRRKDYEKLIEEAKARVQKKPQDVELLLRLAEIIATLDPEDKRCVTLCEEIREIKGGVRPLELQRQGDFWYLYGRSLFFAERFDECHLSLLSARSCYKEQGNTELRKKTNTGLLRVYAALGKSKLAAERLEVALTLCKQPQEQCLLYMHAKHALEETGDAADAEVLDNIWYVEMDTNPELRKTYEQMSGTCKEVMRSTDRPNDTDNEELTWEEFQRRMRLVFREKEMQYLIVAMIVSMFLLILALMRLATYF